MVRPFDRPIVGIRLWSNSNLRLVKGFSMEAIQGDWRRYAGRPYSSGPLDEYLAAAGYSPPPGSAKVGATVVLVSKNQLHRLKAEGQPTAIPWRRLASQSFLDKGPAFGYHSDTVWLAGIRCSV